MNRSRTKNKLVGLPGLAALLLLATTLAACGSGKTAEASAGGPRLPVEAAPARSVAWSEGLQLTGTLYPLRRAMPGTVLMGRVEEVRVAEGDRVRRGAVLARVESQEVRARLAQAEAAVTAARAAEQNAALMKRRMERLHARQAASQQNLDDARTGYEAAAANLRAAEQGVEAARRYVAYSEVVAPFDAVVLEKRVNVGDTAAPGAPLFVLDETDSMKVDAQIAESKLGLVREGDGVEVELPALNATREGSVAEILPAADPASRTFTVRIVLDNADRSLRPGMFARVRIATGSTDSVAVPRTAIVHRGPLVGLFVVDRGGDSPVARLRWVALGRERGDEVRVLSGLEPGELVVVAPTPKLRDGAPVEVRG